MPSIQYKNTRLARSDLSNTCIPCMLSFCLQNHLLHQHQMDDYDNAQYKGDGKNNASNNEWHGTFFVGNRIQGCAVFAPQWLLQKRFSINASNALHPRISSLQQ